MSTFKRRVQGNQVQPMKGTISVSGSPSLLQVSTGIPSLDDLLGGGLPLGQVLLVLAPDYHSSWGELVSRYFIAQGLSSGHRLVVSDHKPARLVSGCMWYPGSRGQETSGNGNEDIGVEDQQQDDKVRIAWRYEQLKQFKTTVEITGSKAEDYCHTFDLAVTVNSTTIQRAIHEEKLIYYEFSDNLGVESHLALIQQLQRIVADEQRLPTRICINNFGGYHWNDAKPSDLLSFLLRLRSSIRNTGACVLLTLPAQISRPDYAPHWIERLSYLSDGCISFRGITSDPVLGPAFPSYSGLLTVHSTPHPHTLLDPSRRFSQLRGLNISGTGSTNSIAGTGGGENNLAFKCMRKRFVVETLHLDVEGGVGERRTTPSAASVLSSSHIASTEASQPKSAVDQSEASHLAKLVVDQSPVALPGSVGHGHVSPEAVKPKKFRKKVAFQADDKDLYDF